MPKDDFIILYNQKLLPNRINDALKTDAVKEVASLKGKADGNILCVGTGGSYAAALFAAKCVNTYEKGTAVAVKPRDALLYPLEKYSLVLLFSYSGTTNDIQVVYRVCRKKGVAVRVITALDKNFDDCPYEREETISYCSSSPDFEERGFISMASTLIPVCLFAKSYYDGVDAFEKYLSAVFSQNEKKFSAPILSDKKTPLTVDVFTAYDTGTASAIIESDIIESGIGRAVTHEKKDFSHGRYNAIEAMPPDLVVFLDNKTGAYSAKLKEYLSERISCPLLVMKTEYDGIWGDFDLAVGAQFLISELSEETDYDASAPVYPAEAKSLYRYADCDVL